MKKTFDVMEKILQTIITSMLFIFIGLVAMQVIWRYVLSDPLPWTEQAARYLFIWMLMLEMPILLRRKNNMAFDLLYNKFPVNVQKVVQILTLILVGAFGVVYFVVSLELCSRSLNKVAVGLNIPIVWVYAAQPVGAALLALTAVEQTIDSILEWTKKKEAKN